MSKTTNQVKKNRKTNTPSSIFAIHSPFHSFSYPLFESLLIHGTMLIEKQSVTLFYFCFSFCQKRFSGVRGTDVRNRECVRGWYWFCVVGGWGFDSTRGLCFGWECDAFGYYLITIIKIQVWFGCWMKKSEGWTTHAFRKCLPLSYEDSISLHKIRIQRLYWRQQEIPTKDLDHQRKKYVLFKCTYMMTPNQSTGFDFSKSTLYP